MSDLTSYLIAMSMIWSFFLFPVSKALYERSSSKDKTFKLYDGMWHALTEGEPPENVALVMRDMISWLGERSRKGGVKLSNTSQNGIDYSDNESTVVNSL